MVESWKDIAAEVRRRAAVAARQPAEGKVYHSAVAGMLNDLADRMEEAEVGNAAKMRETLKWLLKDIEDEAHANGTHHCLCQPFIVRANRGCYAESVDEPLSSQQAHTVHHALCQPLLLDHFKNGKVSGTDGPLGTQTTHDRYSILQPLILGQQSGASARPTGEPCPTIATGGAVRVVIPVVMDKAVGLPRLPDGRYLDIRMRMLKPSELAAAHSFPKDYVFTGTKTEQIKQIGNSVPVQTAAAMYRADLEAA